MRRALRAVVIAFSVTGIALGCGATDPNEVTIVVVPDAAPDALASEAGPDDTLDAGHDGGVIECGGCVLTTCGSVIDGCIGSKSCLGVMECLTTKCLVGSALEGLRDGSADGKAGLNTSCLLTCAGSDPAGAIAVLGVFQCISGTCGSDCGSILGPLAGGLGGLGGKGSPVDPDGLREVLTPWPELVSQ